MSSGLRVGEGGLRSQFILFTAAFIDFLLDRLLGFWVTNASCLQSWLSFSSLLVHYGYEHKSYDCIRKQVKSQQTPLYFLIPF